MSDVFTLVPDEIVVHVLSFLNEGLGSVAQVCRRWNYLARDPMLWRTVIVPRYTQLNTKRWLKRIFKLKPRDLTLRMVFSQVTDEVVRIISENPILMKLNLRHCLNISNSSIHHLCNLNQLNTLDLGCCLKLTGSGLNHLTRLSKLCLYYCENFGDYGMENLMSLTSLKILDLSWCCKLSNDGLANIRVLTNLKTLTLRGCSQISEAGMLSLLTLTNLLSLCLSGNKLDDQGMLCLANMPSLKSLHIFTSPLMTDHELGHLTLLTNLKSLGLYDFNLITSTGMVYVAWLTGLTSLSLVSCPSLNASGLDYVATMDRLVDLDLSDCKNVLDISPLTHLIGLTSLRLNALSSDEIFHISNVTGLSNLVHLELRSNARLTDNVLTSFSHLRRLKRLDINRCAEITRKGLVALESLYGLQLLYNWGREESRVTYF